MKTKFYYTILTLIVFAWMPKSYAQTPDRDAINAMLDNWHKAAAESNFNAYFASLTDDSVFIGTDPTEIWNKTAFQNFAKPYFEKNQGWNFKAVQRQISFDSTANIAWFDELLDTSNMKICRGSGVLEKINGQWKIKQYVLSVTIPNNDLDAVIKIIAPSQDLLLKNYLLKK